MPNHALRDTLAVLLLESGASLEFIQKRLGQKNFQTTVDFYTHVSKKIEIDAIDKYETHMETVLEKVRG
nr:tyrosine-type recombinase/integrase [Evansella clarkii]